MRTTRVYSIFTHSFSTDNTDKVLHYYEKQYVKGFDYYVICIDDALATSRLNSNSLTYY